MSLLNITIDDFDPIIAFADYAAWSTNNPEDNPTWYNATPDVTGSIWHETTYHYTTVIGQSATFNITSSLLAIYGSSGPSFGNYSVTIDPSSANPYIYSNTAYAAQNSTESGQRFLLYETAGLNWAEHEVVVTNLGGGMLLDLVVIGGAVGAEGATLTNTTIDDPSSLISYSGGWISEDGNFVGGTAIYANGSAGAGASFTTSFEGSAVYIFGDQVNDNGFYTVSLNSTPMATLNGRSGCDGLVRKYCEKLGGLKFIATGLPEGTHTLELVNGDGFFNLDYIMYTTPSTYPTQTLVSNATCPFTDCSYLATDSSASTAVSSSKTTGTATSSGTIAGTASATSTSASSGAGRAFGSGRAGLLGSGLSVGMVGLAAAVTLG